MFRTEIHVKGIFSRDWSEWFGDLLVWSELPGETIIYGDLPDMAAVYRLLSSLGNLVIPLVSVICREDDFP
jgi:hypothetical protein